MTEDSQTSQTSDGGNPPETGTSAKRARRGQRPKRTSEGPPSPSTDGQGFTMPPSDEGQSAHPPASEKQTINRLSIPLTDDGKIDWDSMRSATRGKTERLLRENQLQTDGPVEILGPMECGYFYTILGELESNIIARATKTPVEEIRPIFHYSRDEIQMLVPPTVAVANKHLGPALSKWKEELALGMCLVAIHQRKLFAFMEMRKQQIESQTKPDANATTEKPAETMQ